MASSLFCLYKMEYMEYFNYKYVATKNVVTLVTLSHLGGVKNLFSTEQILLAN